MADDDVLLDVGDDGVAVFTLNRPDRRNGWNPELEHRLFALLDEAQHDPRVRVGILTGAGHTFCPGYDTSRLDVIAGKPMDITGRRSPATAWGWPKPLIAAINGSCAGIGLVQALLCDVRFAARGAKFTTAFARRGLAGEYGIVWLLPRLIGLERATDLLLSGRVFDADDALAYGMISRVTEPEGLLPAARAYAADIATNCSPSSLALLKHQLHADLQTDFPTALERAYRAMHHTAVSADFREGIDSFLARRCAQFAALPNNFDPGEITGAAAAESSMRPQDVRPL